MADAVPFALCEYTFSNFGKEGTADNSCYTDRQKKPVNGNFYLSPVRPYPRSAETERVCI